MRPPSFRFLSPSGRFEVNREICLSISNYHEEEWQPAWGVRTAVVALRGFMENDPKGQVGGMECSQGQRRMIALESRAWKCETCGKSSAEILKESEEAARELGEEGRVEVVMPPELRIGYKKVEAGEGSPGSAEEGEEAPLAPTPTVPLVPVENSSPPPPQVQEVNRVPVHLQGPLPPYLDPRYAPTPQQAHEEDTFWVDRLIFGLVVALVAVVAKKLLA